jgi:YD repeat-containing protein
MKSFWTTLCLFLGAYLLFFVGPSKAQQNPCIATNLFFWGDPIPPGWVCGPGEGPYSMLCSGPTVNCLGKMMWCPTCGKWVPIAGNPINLTNGNTYIQENDVRLPGLGGGISLLRTWNSIWPSSVSSYRTTGIFGPNWRSTYEERIISDPATPSYLRSDGGLWYFSGSGTSFSLAVPKNAVASLTNDGTHWTLTFQNGEKKIFSYASGSLLQIIDRNGNTTQLTYDTGGARLVGVTDAASRHLYFTYTGSVVTSVTSDFGVSLSYTYDGSGRLSTVTKPDGSSWNFTYDSASLISAVKDGSGVLLESHTYDSVGRGLTSSQAGGVNAISISYH